MVGPQENGQINPNNDELSTEETSFSSANIHPKQVMITDEELRNLQKETLEYKDKYLRLLADGENARKRMQKERQELTKYAIENVLIDFIKPIDNMENALKFAQGMSDEIKHWAFGFQMILTQFKDILSEQGVSTFDSMGVHFDPHLHEAVEVIDDQTQPPGTVVEEYVKGYKMGDKTIRPARVKVTKTNEINNNKKES